MVNLVDNELEIGIGGSLVSHTQIIDVGLGSFDNSGRHMV